MNLDWSRVIAAIDTESIDEAKGIVGRYSDKGCGFKIGGGIVLSHGLGAIAALGTGRVFVDMKLHDIPNSVAIAARAIDRRGAWMTTLHASGGSEMMKAARDAVEKVLLVAVTVLTSLDDAMLSRVGTGASAMDQALRLAELAIECGMDGIVASPHEAKAIRRIAPDGFLIVTPGIRPVGAARHDQQRAATPEEALEAGADYLVIGRALASFD